MRLHRRFEFAGHALYSTTNAAEKEWTSWSVVCKKGGCVRVDLPGNSVGSMGFGSKPMLCSRERSSAEKRSRSTLSSSSSAAAASSASTRALSPALASDMSSVRTSCHEPKSAGAIDTARLERSLTLLVAQIRIQASAQGAQTDGGVGHGMASGAHLRLDLRLDL